MGFRGGMNQPTLRAPFFAAPTVTGPWILGALIASATQGDSTGQVTVVVPQGTPPLRRRPETREEAQRHALDLIPGYAFEQTMRPVPPDHSERTLVGDARDLFVHVVRKATGGLARLTLLGSPRSVGRGARIAELAWRRVDLLGSGVHTPLREPDHYERPALARP